MLRSMFRPLALAVAFSACAVALYAGQPVAPKAVPPKGPMTAITSPANFDNIMAETAFEVTVDYVNANPQNNPAGDKVFLTLYRETECGLVFVWSDERVVLNASGTKTFTVPAEFAVGAYTLQAKLGDTDSDSYIQVQLN